MMSDPASNCAKRDGAGTLDLHLEQHISCCRVATAFRTLAARRRMLRKHSSLSYTCRVSENRRLSELHLEPDDLLLQGLRRGSSRVSSQAHGALQGE